MSSKIKRDAEGRIHADDGPAIIDEDGSFAYYYHGKIHRGDGPAVRLVHKDGSIEEQFWFGGKEIK